MFYPYCTVNETEIVHTPLNSAGQTLVHIEEPSEVAYWVDFCRHNAGILLNCASQGGIANADYI